MENNSQQDGDPVQAGSLSEGMEVVATYKDRNQTQQSITGKVLAVDRYITQSGNEQGYRVYVQTLENGDQYTLYTYKFERGVTDFQRTEGHDATFTRLKSGT